MGNRRAHKRLLDRIAQKQHSGAKNIGNSRTHKRLLDRIAQKQHSGAKNIGNSRTQKRLLKIEQLKSSTVAPRTKETVEHRKRLVADEFYSKKSTSLCV